MTKDLAGLAHEMFGEHGAELEPHPPIGATAKPYRAATREGLKKVTVGLTPEQHAELKILSTRKSVHGRVTIEDLLREAVVELLARSTS